MDQGINWTIQVVVFARPYASRFVRNHPEEAHQLFQGLARCLAHTSLLTQDCFNDASLLALHRSLVNPTDFLSSLWSDLASASELQSGGLLHARPRTR